MNFIMDINDDNSKIQIFIDGSKTEEGVGAGIATGIVRRTHQ
jgi:hypothetical protein